MKLEFDVIWECHECGQSEIPCTLIWLDNLCQHCVSLCQNCFTSLKNLLQSSDNSGEQTKKVGG